MYLGAKNPFLFVFTCRPIDEQDHPFLTLADNFQSKTEIDLKVRLRCTQHLLQIILLYSFVPRLSLNHIIFVRAEIETEISS